MPQSVEAVGHQGRQETGYAVVTADADDVTDVVDAKAVRIETATVAAVDLQIEQRRGDPARLDVRAPRPGRPHVTDEAISTEDINDFASRIMTATQAHDRPSVSPLAKPQAAKEAG